MTDKQLVDRLCEDAKAVERDEWARINEQWSAGVGVGEPGYLEAAQRLLFKFFQEAPVPPNVALAAGYVLAQAGGSKSEWPPDARERWVVEWQGSGSERYGVVFEKQKDAVRYQKEAKDLRRHLYRVREIKDHA